MFWSTIFSERLNPWICVCIFERYYSMFWSTIFSERLNPWICVCIFERYYPIFWSMIFSERLNVCGHVYFFIFFKFVDMFIVSYISTWSAPKNACHGVNYKFNCQILVYTTFFSISWWSEITSAHDEGPVKGACQLYSRITRLFLHSHAPICMSSRDV